MKTSLPIPSVSRTLFSGIVLAVLAAGVSAQEVTWNNTGTDFNAGGSWQGGNPPGAANYARFNAAAVTSPRLSAPIGIIGLSFSAAEASGYTLSTTDAAALTLTGTGTASGTAAIWSGSSGLNTISAPIILGNNAGALERTFHQQNFGTLLITGNISETNPGTILRVGGNNGTVTLSGTNSHTGGTSLYGNSATRLNIGSASALGTGALSVDNGNVSIDNSSGAALDLNNTLVLNNQVIFVGTHALSFANTSLGTAGGTKNVTVDAGKVTLHGNMANGTSTGALRKYGAGTLVLTGLSTFTGAMEIYEGVLEVKVLADGGVASSIGAGSTNSSHLNINGGTLRYVGESASSTDRNFNLTANGSTLDASGLTDAATVTFGGSGSVNVGGTPSLSRTLTLTGSNTGRNTMGRNIINPSSAQTSLLKAGPGTWVLTGSNTYTGTTTISGGTLLVDSLTAAGSAVSVNAGRLGGTGTINGPTVISNGATLLGGGGALATGTLSLAGDVTFEAGSVIELALGAGGHSSIARTGGTWSFDLAQTFSFLDVGIEATLYENLITGLTGTESGLAGIENWHISNAGWIGSFSYSDGGVHLTLAAIPEPGACLLLLGGAGVLFGLRRRLGTKR